MSDWRRLKVERLGPIERVVAVFRIGPPLEQLPFASFKVKVVERPDGSFLGIPNVSCRSSDGSPDWIAGSGTSVDEALEDTSRWFAKSLGDGTQTREDQFAWADPGEF